MNCRWNRHDVCAFRVGYERRLGFWTLGAVLTFFSDQVLKGAESNQNKPLPGYFVINLHAVYRLTDHAELFADVSNLLDAKYATFAQFGDPTGIGAAGVPAVGADSRFLAPGAPIAVYGGVRITF